MSETLVVIDGIQVRRFRYDREEWDLTPHVDFGFGDHGLRLNAAGLPAFSDELQLAGDRALLAALGDRWDPERWTTGNYTGWLDPRATMSVAVFSHGEEVASDAELVALAKRVAAAVAEVPARADDWAWSPEWLAAHNAAMGERWRALLAEAGAERSR